MKVIHVNIEDKYHKELKKRADNMGCTITSYAKTMLIGHVLSETSIRVPRKPKTITNRR